MTRRNPERPPGPSYYRLPEASWTMIRDEYLSGWTAKEIGAKWRVSATSVYRHACDNGWTKAKRGQAFHDQIVAEGEARTEALAGPDESWSWKAPPEGLRQGPRPLPGMGRPPRRVWSPPDGYGPMPPHLIPPLPRPPNSEGGPAFEDPDPPSAAPSAGEAAERAVAAAARAVAAGRYEEAERLGRLAVTLQKLAGGGAKAKGAAPFRCIEDEENEADVPYDQRKLACTPATCVLEAERRRNHAKIFDFRNNRLKFSDCCDVLAWADMMAGLGATIKDDDVRRLVATLKAEGPGQVHGLIEQVVGRPPSPFVTHNP